MERGSIGIPWRGIIGSLKWVFVNRYVTALGIVLPFFKVISIVYFKGPLQRQQQLRVNLVRYKSTAHSQCPWQ